MNNILYTVILSLTSVIVLFIIAKLLGKKQVAQLEFIDYVIGISIGSIAAEMATDIKDKPMYFYIIAMAIYFLFDLSITLLGRKSPSLKHFFKGRPLTIIYDGEINYKMLKKSKLDVNDVIAMARSQGYFDLEDIAYAIFENNGNLSIMPKAQQRPTVVQDLDIPTKQAQLPTYLVIDGIVSKSSLNEINKDMDWLFNKLNIKHHSQLKNIIFVSYNQDIDKVNITYKTK